MSSAVIFDMDGTLFQTDKILEWSLNETFQLLRDQKKWNKETPIEVYRKIMGVPLPVVWETLLPEHTLEDRTFANEEFHEQLILSIESGRGALYPNVQALFQNLKADHHHLFIASNGQTEYLEAIVRHYGLQEWITETFSIQQIQSQNKSDLVKRIAEKHLIKDGFVVGDRLSDIMAAKDNQFISIGCKFDFAQEEELALADYVVEDLLEVHAITSLITMRVLD
ncbi:nucleosidase [Bacillus sp. HMSC76G11]|nr:nucleosidase [Bacillus sp. HMSC76G11]